MAVKVLILEASPVTRSLLARIVRESFSDVEGIELVADVATAREAVARETEGGARRFGLILVDLELPDGQGLAWLAELGAHPAKKVATTLFPDAEHLFPAIQAGAEGYLLKEARFEALVEDLQCIARGQPPLAPALARRMLLHFGLPLVGTPAVPPQRSTASADPAAARPGAVPVAAAAMPRLEPREAEVLTHLSKGFTIKEIASLTGLPWTTVREHVRTLFRKAAATPQPDALPCA